MIFDLSVRVSERKGGGSPNVLGRYAQGKPDDRFISLNSGTMAGLAAQRFRCWAAGRSAAEAQNEIVTDGSAFARCKRVSISIRSDAT